MKGLSLPFQTIVIIILLLLFLVIVAVFLTKSVTSGQSNLNHTTNIEQLCPIWRAMGCELTNAPAGLDQACYDAGIEVSIGVGTNCQKYCCPEKSTI